MCLEILYIQKKKPNIHLQTLGDDAVRNYVVEMKELSEDDWKPCSKFVEGTNYRVPCLRENQKYLFRVFAESVRGKVGEALEIVEAVVARNPFSKMSYRVWF